LSGADFTPFVGHVPSHIIPAALVGRIVGLGVHHCWAKRLPRVKSKNQACVGVQREAEEDWRR